MNLASSSVLRSIETAVDTGVVTLPDDSDAQSRTMTIPVDPNFRLFGTQNPSTGFFGGKREKLDADFTSRFQVVNFLRIPSEEWCTVVATALKKRLAGFPGIEKGAPDLARLMVGAHDSIAEKIAESAFIEKAAYAETTVRELLKWQVGVANAILRHGPKWPSDYMADAAKQVVAFEGWAVYVARFRSQETRNLLQHVLCDELEVRPDVVDKLVSGRGAKTFAELKLSDGILRVDGNDVELPCQEPMPPTDEAMKAIGIQFQLRDDVLMKRLLAVHKGSLAAVLSPAQLSSQQLYCIPASAMLDTLALASERLPVSTTPQNTKSCLALAALDTYVRVARNPLIKGELEKLVLKHFEVERDLLNHMEIGVPSSVPLVLTRSMRLAAKLLLRAIAARQPVLLVGREATGKSELVLRLGAALGHDVLQYFITGETDPSDLVGAIAPDTLKWRSGVVTQAVEQNCWVLLDNLSDAEAVVTERLNP